MKYKIAWKSEIDGKVEYGDIEYSSLEEAEKVIEYLHNNHKLFAWIITIVDRDKDEK